jgi:hypothetical protein
MQAVAGASMFLKTENPARAASITAAMIVTMYRFDRCIAIQDYEQNQS